MRRPCLAQPQPCSAVPRPRRGHCRVLGQLGQCGGHRAAGFTLVEMLVAVALLALIGSMSWLGLDALLRTRERTAQMGAYTTALNTSAQQWLEDLQHLSAPPGTQAVHVEAGKGSTFVRLTRRAAVVGEGSAHEAGLRVVAWAVSIPGAMHGGDAEAAPQLMRWQSPPVRTLQQWTTAWAAAANWATNPTAHSGAAFAHALMPAKSLEVQLWHLGRWQMLADPPQLANAPAVPSSAAASAGAAPQSHTGTAQRLRPSPLPAGVRLQVHGLDAQPWHVHWFNSSVGH